MQLEDFISTNDLSDEQLSGVMDMAAEMKRHPDRFRGTLEGKTLILLFEKPSLRTRTTFEVAMTKLSGHSIYFGPADAQLGHRESVADVARNLERWVDAISARTFLHQTVLDLAKWSGVPVINALSDYLHPCQALADLLTLREHLGDLEGKKLTYVGDGNNVSHSLLLAGPRFGMDVTVVTPVGYAPRESVVNDAKTLAEKAGSRIDIVTDLDAVEGSDAVYTDVWASMGQETEAADRKRIFGAYQVNAALMARAREGALFLHCLPAHRGDEVTDEVADATTSVIFDQAENRLWTQMAVLHAVCA